jgi:redox-sensitive bicupin YhaK (pirin superfamily)
MSAGSGLLHSEKNNEEESVHLYQIWIEPRETGVVPRHAERDFSNIKHNALVPVAS